MTARAQHLEVEPDIPCFACGSPNWAADWHGSMSVVGICRKCALKIMPVWFADATWSPGWAMNDGSYDLKSFVGDFWLAQASNESRARHRRALLPFNVIKRESKDV